jgi:enamine deaminase RidA (YjgF/YER057c/UK114 family)
VRPGIFTFYEIHRMTIQRINPGNRLCDATIHNGVAYLAGQIPEDASLAITAQTQSVLDQIDTVLAQAGSDKAHILTATIYLSSMGDFAAMNAVWDAWIGTSGIGPARATVEARLARPDIKVEIMVAAAVK